MTTDSSSTHGWSPVDALGRCSDRGWWADAPPHVTGNQLRGGASLGRVPDTVVVGDESDRLAAPPEAVLNRLRFGLGACATHGRPRATRSPAPFS